MKASFLATFFSLTLALAGCASTPQAPVPLGPDAITSTNTRIGIALTTVPKPDTYFPGASCLLCVAAASMANSTLTSYTQTLSKEELLTIKEQLAQLIRKKGPTTVLITENISFDNLPKFANEGPNIFKKDVSSLRSRFGVDKLLLIQVTQLGILRTYSAYFPTSDPKATVSGQAFIVNLNSNTYEWYLPLDVLKSSDGPWDEAPKFPGLTNAYFQAVETAKDQILEPFGK